MKKTVFSVLIVFAVMLCIAGGFLLSGDKSVEIFTEIPPGASLESISFTPEGIAELFFYETETDSSARIVFRMLNPGETNAVLKWNGVDEAAGYSSEMTFPLKGFRIGTILEKITGNFTGWQGVAMAAALFLAAVSVILFISFLKALKTDMYSYTTVRYLGFALYVFLLSIMRFGYLFRVISGGGNGTVWELLVGISSSAQKFMIWTSPAVFAFAIALAVSNGYLMFREGAYPSNMFALIFAGCLAGGAILGNILVYSRRIYEYRNLLISVYSGLFCYLECIFFATTVCDIIAARHTPAYDKDFVMILGCRVRPDGSLYPIIKSRVDRAIRFVGEQQEKTGKQAIFVPSGGKGNDEQLSEGRAMEKYLLEHGVAPERILTEDQSLNTAENMRFSRILIESAQADAKIAFSTSNFHVFRSGILAKTEGFRPDGMGSPTKWYFWPNAFVREFIAMLAESAVQQAAILCAICAICGALTMIL